MEAGTVPSLEPASQTMPPDPSRSRGDVSENIKQHFDDILEGNHAPASQAIDIETSQLHYVHEDDADRDMQALGPSVIEEAAKLSELCFADDNDGPVSDNQMQTDEQELPVSQIESTPSFSLPTESSKRGLQDDESQKATREADASTEHNTRKIGADIELPEAEGVEISINSDVTAADPSGRVTLASGEVREADLHPAGAGLVSGRQAIQAKRDQDCRRCPTQRVQINNSAEGHDEGRWRGRQRRECGCLAYLRASRFSCVPIIAP